MTRLNRRAFLGGAAATSMLVGTGALGAMTAGQAFAADTTGYRALVCLFLIGGMDHADTILPYDQESWDMLRDQREGLFNTYNVGSGTSSRDRENLVRLNPSNPELLAGRELALPPQLAPLNTAFDAGDLAFVGNVGPLIAPTDRDSYDNRSVALPKRLFSHNDQQSTWMALSTEGERYGWGGRFADIAAASSPGANTSFTSVTVGRRDVFLSGQTTLPFNAPGGEPRDIRMLEDGRYLGRGSDGDEARELMEAAISRGDFGSSNLYERDIAAVAGRAIDLREQFRNAYNTVPEITTPFPDTDVGRQLASVARVISMQQALNVRRQIFFVGKGGFDTHSNQAGNLTRLHTEIAEAVMAFRAAMVEIAAWQDVTLFTASDFGRTTIDNGDGTDHGWGGHQFVMGGSVQGGQLYGTFPFPDPDGERYTPSRGRLIPTVSVEQYAARLGSWFGLDQSELASVLPNLSNFDAADAFV